jgi:hypothetical protein
MAIMNYSLFGSSTLSSIDFQEALAFYVKSPLSQTLMAVVERTFVGSHSVMEADAPQLFSIFMEYCLGVLHFILPCSKHLLI